MWNTVVDIVVTAVLSCFDWLNALFDAIPGAWNTIFTIIVILLLARFMLGPILGAMFSVGSDKARRSHDSGEK